MKKVIGLCLVVLLSSTSVFARENRRMDKRKMDPSARCEMANEVQKKEVIRHNVVKK